MAKKAVATLQTGNSGRAHSKCILNEKVQEYFK